MTMQCVERFIVSVGEPVAAFDTAIAVTGALNVKLTPFLQAFSANAAVSS
jgi:hypothetical protein